MFTYYLLKKLQETEGNLSYKQLADYIEYEVQINSIIVNGKDQNPEVLSGYDIEDKWKSWKFVE